MAGDNACCDYNGRNNNQGTVALTMSSVSGAQAQPILPDTSWLKNHARMVAYILIRPSLTLTPAIQNQRLHCLGTRTC